MAEGTNEGRLKGRKEGRKEGAMKGGTEGKNNRTKEGMKEGKDMRDGRPVLLSSCLPSCNPSPSFDYNFCPTLVSSVMCSAVLFRLIDGKKNEGRLEGRRGRERKGRKTGVG